MKLVSKIISIALHPLLMPTLGILVVFNSGTHLSIVSFELQRSVYIITFICTFLLPISVIPFFIFHKLVKNVELETPKERITPLIVTTIFFYLGYYILNHLFAPKLILLFLIGTFIAIALTTLITFFWKISAHMIGIGGILGLLIGISIHYGVNLQTQMMLCIFLGGLVGFARLSLNAHRPAQVYSGFALGMVTVAGVLLTGFHFFFQ